MQHRTVVVEVFFHLALDLDLAGLQVFSTSSVFAFSDSVVTTFRATRIVFLYSFSLPLPYFCDGRWHL